MQGELHPTRNRFQGGLSCNMFNSVDELNYFLVWPLPETAVGSLCNYLAGLPYTFYVVRSSPLCGVWFSPHKNDQTRPPAMVTAKTNKRYPCCLPHAVRDVFYSVVAIRCQPRETKMYTVYIISLVLTFTFQPTATRRRVYPSDFLDKTWSQVSSLLPPGTCLYFLSRIGFSIPTARRFSSNVAKSRSRGFHQSFFLC